MSKTVLPVKRCQNLKVFNFIISLDLKFSDFNDLIFLSLQRTYALNELQEVRGEGACGCWSNLFSHDDWDPQSN